MTLFARKRVWCTAFAAVLIAGCGKDEADFEDLKGQFGTVPGNFNVRLGQSYRDQVDGLASKLDGFMPGLTAQLTNRFDKSDDETVDSGGTKLSDLLAVKLPGTESKLVNQQIFSELSALTGDKGPYFALVDTGKYTKGPAAFYTPPTGAGRDASFADQYYLEMIHWADAVAAVDPLLPDAVPVVVAVFDTGVRADHEDLANVMWQNAQGAVGYDAANKVALAKSESKDVNGHGTHVAGIIGGQGGNAKGIHGVAYIPGRDGVADQSITEIMNVKVLNDAGAGTSEEVAVGMRWAVKQHWDQQAAVPARAKQRMIINMSLGGPFDVDGYDYKQENGEYVFEDDVFNYATQKGDVLIVVAAGNESCGIGGSCDLFGDTFNKAYYYPCSYEHVLCVAASTHEDKLAGFSNRQASVSLAAPGWQIVSSVPQGTDSYGYYSGTSQATPVTAGAAAVVWSLYPDFTGEEVKQILENTSSGVAEITGEIKSGHGRLNLEAALAYAKALKAAGKKPADQAPDAAILDGSKVTPTAAPTGGGDPAAGSPSATSSSPDGLGDGSANGCAVIGGGSTALFGWLLALFVAAPAFAAATKKIEVQGHRGARSIKPENTLPAFQYALEQGVDTLELDLGVTKDDVVIVSHDPVISPVICLGPDGKAPAEGIAINSLTLAELKKYDCGTLKNPRFPQQQPVAGTPKPTLEEVFALVAASPLPVAKTVHFNIETKIVPREVTKTPSPEAFAKLVVDLVKKHKLEDRVVIQSFDHRSLVAAKKLAPNIRIAPLVGDSLPDWPALIKATKAEIISPNLNWITPETVAAAQKAGARVIPWTANTAEEWDYLIKCGVDGIITDDPAALIAHLRAKNLRG